MVNDAWTQVIASFLTAQKAAGYPPTTVDLRRQHLEHMARRIGASPPEVTEDQLIDYMAGQTWARETRRGRRQTFRTFWGWAFSTGRVPLDVAAELPRVRAGEPNPRPCPDGAYLRAIAAADRRVRLMLRLGAELGLRRAEVACIHARDLVDDLGGMTLLVHGKGQKQRMVPLPAGIAAELLEQCDGGYAFAGDDSGHLSPRWVGKLVGRLMPDGVTMHTLRHRFASRAWGSGVDVFVLQSILGHASPATTRMYVAVPQTAARTALEGLARAA